MKLIATSSSQHTFYEPTQKDLAHGVLIVGQSGTGQDELLASMVLQEIAAGHSVALIDPVGSLLPRLLDYIPGRAIDQTAFLDASDRDYPISLNVLEQIASSERALVKEGVLEALRAIFGDSWGPRMEYILAYAIMALLEPEGTNLLSLPRLLSESRYRRSILNQVEDPFVRQYFAIEYAGYSDRFREEAIAPIHNKVGQFALDPLLRHIVGQHTNKASIERLVATNTSILASVPAGTIGQTAARLLGIGLLTKVLHAAKPDDELPRLSLYLPHIEQLASPGLAAILERSQHRRVNLIVSCSNLSTLDRQLQSTLLTQLMLPIGFRLGFDDAELLKKHLTVGHDEIELVNLQPGRVAYKPVIQGRVHQMPQTGYAIDFSNHRRTNNRETIMRQSRERYAVPRAVIADRLQRYVNRQLTN